MSLQFASRMGVFLVVAAMLAASASAQTKTEAAGSTISPQELKAKTGYCKTCHGLQGQGFRGSIAMPRLAGQQPEYIENQLKAFIEQRRSNPVMRNVVHAMSPAMLMALTTEFRNLNPKPLGGARKDHVAEGKKIFDEGIPDHNVPPCASCHGPDAKGDGQFPRLAGQLFDYIIRKLADWDKERGQNKATPDTSTIMQPIAHELTPSQVAAVAAYVSQLE